MGRWDYGIYDSDTSLDFLSEVTDLLIKEAAYWFSPEKVFQDPSWILEALTIVEIMLIIAEEDHIGSSSHLNGEHMAVRRWKDIFFSIWDSEWDDTSDYLPYGSHNYRLTERHIANTLFDRLIEHADDWENIQLRRGELQPFALKLPYLSVRRVTGRDGQEFSRTGYFLGKFVDRLLHFIVFTFSEEHAEMRWGLDYGDIEKVCVAVDLIGELCTTYQVPPGLRPATIHHWLDRVISFWIEYYDRPESPVDIKTLSEKDGLYKNSVDVFVRLMTAAQLHPGAIPR